MMEQGMLNRLRPSFVTLAIFTAACTISETPRPSLTGPSEYAVSLSISVQDGDDLLVLDGHDDSTVIVTARDAEDQPLDLKVLLEILVDGQPAESFGTLSTRILSTGADGRETAIYRPPSAGSGFDRVKIRASTIGTNNQLSKSQVVEIRLLLPTTLATGAPLAKFSYSPLSGIKRLQEVSFDATDSRVVSGSRIVKYVWDWRDGTTGVGMIEEHDWENAGTYWVRLTVIDDSGLAASFDQPIVVE